MPTAEALNLKPSSVATMQRQATCAPVRVSHPYHQPIGQILEKFGIESTPCESNIPVVVKLQANEAYVRASASLSPSQRDNVERSRAHSMRFAVMSFYQRARAGLKKMYDAPSKKLLSNDPEFIKIRKQVEDDYSEAIKLDPGFVEAYRLRIDAMTYLSPTGTDIRGLSEKVLLDWNQIIRLEPDNADNYFGRAIYKYEILHDLDGAVADLTKAETIKPGRHIYRRLSDIAFEMGDFAEALKYASEKIKLCPDAASYQDRADIKINLKDWKGAEEDLTQAIKVASPKNFTQSYLYAFRAHLREQQGKWAEAAQDLTQAINKNSDSYSVAEYKARRTLCLIELGRLSSQEALAQFDAIQEQLLTDVDSLLFTGVYQNDMVRRVFKARAAIERNLGLAMQASESEYFYSLLNIPGAEFFWFERLSHLSKTNDHYEFDIYDNKIRQFPKNPHLYWARGKLYLQWKRYTNAIVNLHEAIRLDPNNPVFYYDLSKVQRLAGYMAAAHENKAKASALAEKSSIETKPKH